MSGEFALQLCFTMGILIWDSLFLIATLTRDSISDFTSDYKIDGQDGNFENSIGANMPHSSGKDSIYSIYLISPEFAHFLILISFLPYRFIHIKIYEFQKHDLFLELYFFANQFFFFLFFCVLQVNRKKKNKFRIRFSWNSTNRIIFRQLRIQRTYSRVNYHQKWCKHCEECDLLRSISKTLTKITRLVTIHNSTKWLNEIIFGAFFFFF